MVSSKTRYARNPKLYYFFTLICYSKQCQTDNSSVLEKAFEYLLEHESFFKLRMKVALSIFEIDRLTE